MEETRERLAAHDRPAGLPGHPKTIARREIATLKGYFVDARRHPADRQHPQGGRRGRRLRRGDRGHPQGHALSAARDRRMPDKTPIRMLHDRVLVEVDKESGERRSTGGIVIPATAALGTRRLAWAGWSRSAPTRARRGRRPGAVRPRGQGRGRGARRDLHAAARARRPRRRRGPARRQRPACTSEGLPLDGQRRTSTSTGTLDCVGPASPSSPCSFAPQAQADPDARVPAEPKYPAPRLVQRPGSWFGTGAGKYTVSYVPSPSCPEYVPAPAPPGAVGEDAAGVLHARGHRLPGAGDRHLGGDVTRRVGAVGQLAVRVRAPAPREAVGRGAAGVGRADGKWGPLVVARDLDRGGRRGSRRRSRADRRCPGPQHRLSGCA